ncbi:enoyl-CoA hydratase/isomerase family protein [Desulfoferula mesophila]|uniref:Enoyl-CoA hydratase n=1 Tax=Desulfoferula mesophila TaxID=3058419 RepID=A0AAU9ENE5_9BACT|nr:enoyl-CoA hydratase [Desulfoferula mesophilus]
MSTQLLNIVKQGEVAWVAFNRPQDRNSINSQLMAEFLELLEELEQGPARAVVFTGAGDTHFIGGADGIEMMQLDLEGGRQFSRRFQAMLDRMEASPLLLVAAINGLCFGGGFEFALACDLRVAEAKARIGLPEVKVGLIPGGGGTQRLPALVGSGRAMQMILSGRLYGGTEAETLGLVHLCVADGGLAGGVDQVLAPILRQPQYALSLAKRAVKSYGRGGLEQGLIAEAELFSQCHAGGWFHDLMIEQLKSGALTTSADVRHLLKEDAS